MLIEDLTAFLADVAQERKPTTARFYQSRSRWVEAKLGQQDWPGLKPPDVLRALDQANRWPDGRTKAPDTIRGNIIAWEQFQKWALATGRCAAAVLPEPLKKPSGRHRDRLPSIEEITRILDQAPAEFNAIYRALLLTGARPGELCRATIADYRPNDNVIELAEHKTRGKTGRSRIIPISEHCRAIITQSVGDRTEGTVFVTSAGKPWTSGKLSQAFRRRRDALGLDRRLVLYSARHKFATELCHAQGIEAAAAVLGHSGLQTIRRYVHHDTQQLRNYANGVDPKTLLPPTPPE